MLRVHVFALVLLGVCLVQDAFAIRSAERTVEQADQVLHEIMAIPLPQIPHRLLAEAEGIAIIPGVIKVGFVGGIRRGRGVVIVRDRGGIWCLPRFVILTGGSVGCQVGIQATDVILVFRTKKSIEGLLGGKFTLGVGGSVAAGPVGRSAEAATDVALKAEILSYSRSRGVFAGVVVDGSAIEIDGDSHRAFYGSPTTALPAAVPESAMRLLADVSLLTGRHEARYQASLPVAVDGAIPTAVDAAMPMAADDLRKVLAAQSGRLSALISSQWQRYLALPAEVYAENQLPNVDALKTALQQFDRVAADTSYRGLTQRAEFQATHESLRQYVQQLSTVPAMPLNLPPPPADQVPMPAP
jgi:lipid-binding SYLF domain-containing protein